jgi:putative DNA primase/helicase
VSSRVVLFEPRNGRAPRPTRPPEPIWDNVPQELKSRPRWVFWRHEFVKGKWTKPPYQRDGSKASSTDPATWASFDDIRTAYAAGDYDGIGIVLNADGVLGFDFDHVVDIAGQITDAQIAGYVHTLDSYAEISPSGAGLRVFVEGTLSAQGRKRGNCECYDRARYLTVTGRRLANSPVAINERQAAVNQVHAALFPPAVAASPTKAASPTLDDVALLERARAAANSPKFAALYDHGRNDGYPSASEADLALVSMLAFWTKDAGQIDRLFRASGLMREKWDRDGYRTDTINKALASSGANYKGARVFRHKPADETRGDESHAETHADESRDEPKPAPGYQPPELFRAEGDIFVAGHLFAEHSPNLKWCAGWGWVLYDETRWVRDDANQIFVLVTETVAGFLLQASKTTNKEEEVDKWNKFVAQYSKVERMRGALAVLVPRCAASVEDFDSDPLLLNAKNGTIDLRSGQTRKHSRADMITKIVPIDYDPAAKAPRWEQFLKQIFGGDDKVVAYVQRLIGYSFTGSQREQLITILWGSGGNGKGIFCKMLKECAGDYDGTANIEMLLTQNHPQHPTAMADLCGKRFVIIDESPENGKLNAEKVKTLTGNSTIHARLMRQDFFDFEPTHHFFLLTNYKPIISDSGHGIWRRIRLIPFLVKFEEPTEESPNPEHPMDKDLEGKLDAELSGILRWVVEGAAEWARDGLGEIPLTVKTATAEYRSEEDTLGLFIDECCDVDKSYKELSASLYTEYEKWAERTGEKYSWTDKLLFRRLTDAGYTASKEGSKRFRHEIQVKGLV